MSPSETSLSSSQESFLRGLFPGDDCLLEPEEKLIFGADAGRGYAPPLAVVRPCNQGQIVELLRFAHTEQIPIYPRARGTNVVGDCVPETPGIVVSTLKMNAVKAIDENDFVAVVEPGVVTSDLQAAAEAKKLFYPPDPASMRISTIGGNVATCAGGMRALKYGVTRDYVLGMTAVLPGGEVITTGGRAHKNVVGLDLTRLLVGSEGTLAFITELIIKLLPLPEATASLLVGYSSLEQALDAARDVFAAGILPACLELIAGQSIYCLGQVTDVPWPENTQAALLFRVDGSRRAVDADMDRLIEVIKTGSPSSLDQGRTPEAEEQLWEVRRMINPASFQAGPNKLADDIAVPRGALKEALTGVETICADIGLPVLNFGHLGDGNIHVNVMYDKAVPGQSDLATQAKEKILDLTLSLGGTVSGEHGIGLSKLHTVSKQIGETERGLMRHIKTAFDPHNIMNPGKAY
ncbi:MAG: FAD-binding protein [Desulfovibrio sp.]|nr:MAG: FAD-binding protein [Desulfovibrio sp.]